MKRFGLLLLVVVGTMAGCARPGELGWSPAYSRKELNQQIARNWDWEGKQLVDDVEKTLMLRPMSHLTIWNLR